MARDYKPTPAKPRSTGKGGSLFTGILIGVILGIGVSVAVALFVKGGQSPFTSKDKPQSHIDAAPEPSATTAHPETTETATPAKPRFDFYTILPGNEGPVTDHENKKPKTEPQPSTTSAAAGENYFLQVGSFQTEQEADNVKAKLALLGLEAVVQTANLPDKGIWHRVRVGPYTNIEQISKARDELTKNGFRTDLIKIHNTIPDQ